MRRRRLVAGIALAAIAGVAWFALQPQQDKSAANAAATSNSAPASTRAPARTTIPATTVAPSSAAPTTTAPTTTVPATTTVAPARPSDQLRLRYVTTIGGHISPKSVDASGTGLVFAQNMIYTHTVTVYNDRTFALETTIPDTVRLSAFGYPQYPGTYQGGPVEAAFSPDRRYVYVSNYSMYGPSFQRQGHDVCSPADGYDTSFVYRVDLASLTIDQVIHVGSVPKFVVVTPDDEYVLVSDWCSYALSVISVSTGREVRRIPLGPYPRGIAVDPASHFAYVAVMGSTEIAKINLRTWSLSWIDDVGNGPRQLVMSPNGRWLYATLNADGTVATINLRTDRVVARVATGSQPRSMAIASDGRSLYVVNYGSNTVTKLRASNLAVLQVVRTNSAPIGITYDPGTHEIWVACYTGTIMIFKDS